MDAAYRQAMWEEGERKGGDMGVSLLPPLATFDPHQLPQHPHKLYFKGAKIV